MRRLPPGSGVIYRAFGTADAVAQGQRLAHIARSRGLVLLVGADPRLAAAIGADGVHLPQRLAHRARGLRLARPRWLVTAAAHGPRSIAAARRAGAQAVLLSAVFPSASPSAGRALGVLRFAAMVRAARLPVYALGGIDMKNAPRLLGTGAWGLAAVDGFRT